MFILSKFLKMINREEIATRLTGEDVYNGEWPVHEGEGRAGGGGVADGEGASEGVEDHDEEAVANLVFCKEIWSHFWYFSIYPA